MINGIRQCVEIGVLTTMHHIWESYKACPTLEEIRQGITLHNSFGITFELSSKAPLDIITLKFSDLVFIGKLTESIPVSIELGYESLQLMWPSEEKYKASLNND